MMEKITEDELKREKEFYDKFSNLIYGSTHFSTPSLNPYTISNKR